MNNNFIQFVNEYIEIFFFLTEFLINNDIETLTPYKVWEAAHRGTAFVFVTPIKRNVKYEATIELFRKRFIKYGKTKEEALNAVAFTVLYEVLSITFVKWQYYAKEYESNENPIPIKEKTISQESTEDKKDDPLENIRNKARGLCLFL